MDNVNKYGLMMVDRIKTTFDSWKSKEEILEKEIYYFLHNIKGTAGSIGLMELSELAIEYIQYVCEKSETKFTRNQWVELLKPFIDWADEESEKNKVKHDVAADTIK